MKIEFGQGADDFINGDTRMIITDNEKNVVANMVCYNHSDPVCFRLRVAVLLRRLGFKLN